MLIALLSIAATPVSTDLLAGLPEQNVILEVHGKSQSCRGPALADVVARMGAPKGKDVRGDALRWTVLAKARDGYQVRFSLGEIDALLGASEAIVATQCDGAPLSTQDGPFRLVFPGESRGARSMRQLESLTLER